uniref:Gag-pol polyprotein n=1 Tax=Solanum tuberosum TaxID=4113 RepID=M1DB40_SOLTU
MLARVFQSMPPRRDIRGRSAGFSRLSSKEGKVAMLIGDMDIEMLMIHVQQVEEDKLRDREKFKNKRAKTSWNEFGQQKSNVKWSSFQQKQNGPAPSSASALVQKNKSEHYSQNSKHFRARPAQSQGSVEQGGNWAPACAKYGRTDPGKCLDGSTCCFKCGQESHFMKECLKNQQGNGNQSNRAQFSSVVPPDRAAFRGATSGAGGG